MKRSIVHVLFVVTLAAGLPAAQAHSPGASEASALSALPVAVSMVAPALILSGGAVLTVIAVEASAEGAVWVLQRASDGAQASVVLSAAAAGGLSIAAGTTLVVTAFSAGWVLSAAGRALAYIPNEIGKALLHNERVTW